LSESFKSGFRRGTGLFAFTNSSSTSWGKLDGGILEPLTATLKNFMRIKIGGIHEIASNFEMIATASRASSGTVKWFSKNKGYGFVVTPEGEEIFVHFSSITGRGYRTLEAGDRVTFEVMEGPKGLQAFHVVKEGPSAR
jgi:CspA family cold shock protein